MAPQTADAGTIYYSGPINTTIGIGQSWHTGDGGSLSLGGGSARLGFSLYLCGCNAARARVTPNASLRAGTVNLRTLSNGSYSFLKLVNFGAMQTHAYFNSYGPAIASFVSTAGGLLSGGQQQFADRFALFSFLPSLVTSSADFGWVRFSLSAGANPLTEHLTIVDYAFDSSGARIQAGDTGAVPEPGTLGSTALAALVLGAAGLRRWRAARRTAA